MVERSFTPVLEPRSRLRLAAILLLIAVAWLPAPAARAQVAEAQLAAHFRAGQEALRQGEFVKATEEFKQVLAIDPTLVEAEVNLGLAYQSLLQYEMATRHLTKALRQRANLPAANLIVGMDYLKLSAPEKAGPYLKQALKLDPTNREARRALASAYLRQENFRDAAEEYRQTAVLNPDKPEAWFRLGHDYLELSARLAYRGAHLYRNSAWGHRFLGDLLFLRARWDDAAQEYRKALGLDAHQPGLHAAMGQAYLHAGKLKEADDEFHLEIAADAKNETAWLGLAEKELAAGDAELAMQAVARVWEISPEFLAVQRDFPSVELSRETAKSLAEKIQSSPNGAVKDFLLATLGAAAGDTAEAEAQWKAFQTEVASRKGKQALAGSTEACHAHSYAACLKALQASKTLTVSQRLLLGRTQFLLRQYEPAADSLGHVTGVSNANAEASYWLALTYQALGAEAYAHLEGSFPDSWRAHQLRGEGFALRRDMDNAIKEFHNATQLKPDDAELREAIGEAYLDHQAEDDARKELEASLALDPTRTHAMCLLARIYVQKRENEKAVPYLEKALQLQPDLVEASGLLGTAYVRMGQFAEAVPKLQQAAPLDFYGNVHYQLYLAYRKLGQMDLAQKALTRSQELRQSSLERDQAIVMGVRQSDADTQ